jgi:hypothetical protein
MASINVSVFLVVLLREFALRATVINSRAVSRSRTMTLITATAGSRTTGRKIQAALDG